MSYYKSFKFWKQQETEIPYEGMCEGGAKIDYGQDWAGGYDEHYWKDFRGAARGR
jgi:hypothetical protein